MFKVIFITKNQINAIMVQAVKIDKEVVAYIDYAGETLTLPIKILESMTIDGEQVELNNPKESK